MPRNYFGTPQFAKVGKLFQDLPLEALEKSMTGLNTAYSTNLKDLTATKALMSQIETSKEDRHIKDRKLEELQKKIDDFSQNEGLENADMFSSLMATEFLADKDLNHIKKNYTEQEKDKAIYDQLRAQGINAVDARKHFNKSAYGDGDAFNSITEDAEGNKVYNDYVGGYMKPGEYDKMKTSLFDQMPKRGGTNYVRQPDGSMKAVTWSGIRNKDIENYTQLALDRYKSTDEYQTELIDLQTQGYSPEEAEAMIQESVTATGKERVGMQSREQLYGYQNSNTTKKQEAANNGVRFMRDRKTISISDPNGANYIPGSSLFGSKATDTAGIPINGSGTIPTNGEMTDVVFNKYYKIESKNSDNSKGGQLTKGNFVGKAAHAANVQGFVFEGTNEFAQFGDGAPSDAGKLIEEGSLPEMDNAGRYYVTDKENNPVYLKPRNFKQYLDDKGDMYFVEMDRQEEIRTFGADTAVNTNAFELGASRGDAGDRFVDGFDANYTNNTVTAITYDPQASMKSASTAYNMLGNMVVQNKSPENMKLWGEVQEVLEQNQGNPGKLIAFLNGKVQREGIKEIKSSKGTTKVMSAQGTMIAQVLNTIFNQYEDDNLFKQTPKETVTTNIMDRDSNGFSGFNQED